MSNESVTTNPVDGLLGLQRMEMTTAPEKFVVIAKAAGETAITPETTQRADDYPNRPAFHYLDN